MRPRIPGTQGKILRIKTQRPYERSHLPDTASVAQLTFPKATTRPVKEGDLAIAKPLPPGRTIDRIPRQRFDHFPGRTAKPMKDGFALRDLKAPNQPGHESLFP